MSDEDKTFEERLAEWFRKNARRPIGHTDGALPLAARRRLGGQNARVLDRLRRGPATNVELERVSGSRRINSRIADVRRWLKANEGADVVTTTVNVASGVYQYEIRKAESA